VARGSMQRLLTDDEVTRAMASPPADTRAFFRGECLRRYPAQVAAASWDSVVFDLGRENLVRIPTMEPLRGTREHVGALFEASPTAQDLVDTITGG
jgi:Pup amidohydrolase